MNRTKFFEKVTINNIKELDFLNSTLSDFKVIRDISFYRLNSIDRKRPDIISYRGYNTEKYWWLVCLTNGISDPFFETTIGRIIKFPNILDIFDFFRANKKR